MYGGARFRIGATRRNCFACRTFGPRCFRHGRAGSTIGGGGIIRRRYGARRVFGARRF